MGGGSWTASVHSSRSSLRAATGKSDFDYGDTTMKTKPLSAWVVNDRLDPKSVNKDGAHVDQNIREALDSDDHPESVAIAVLLDETGSMSEVPRKLVKKLPELFGLLLRKGYVEHPQILFGGIGDAFSDRVPLQIGQFESDNRTDEDLMALLLEGNGGGQTKESYELAMYFMARHTFIDCFEKRGHKGYLFIIGDEAPYDTVTPKQVKNLIGDDISEPISMEALVRECQEKWDVYLIRPIEASYNAGDRSGDSIIAAWRALLGQNVLTLDDTNAVCETIALTIGLAEGALGDLDEGLDDLREIGVGESTESVSKALATLSGRGSVVTTDSSPLGIDEEVAVDAS